jgi:outer membrane protein assembly factor BamE
MGIFPPVWLKGAFGTQPLQSSDHSLRKYPMSDLHCNRLRLTLLALAMLGLGGCSSLDGASTRIAGIVSPYKSDIVQGNVVTREQLAAVKPGMQKVQVRDILGTALLVSVFHADRWDYVFTLKRQNVPPQARRVTMFFKSDVLDRIEADELPSEAEFVATLQTQSLKGSRPVLEASPEALLKFPLPTKAAAPPAIGLVVPTDYPPLEVVRP